MSRLTMHLESFASNSPTHSYASRCRALNETSIDLDSPYRLFLPERYEPNYDYPLVVWLHSDASSELELDNVMGALSTQNYVAIAPRALQKCRGKAGLYRWGLTTTETAAAEELVWDCVQAAANSLSINLCNIFLAGFGAGGTLAQWIGLKYASQIAGAVSLSGCFPNSPRVLSNWKRSRKLPVLFGQRQSSTLCTDEELVRAVRISHQSGLGYKFFQMRSEETGCDESNELDSTMLEAANRFMMGIVTNSQLSLLPEENYDNECVEFGIN